MKRKARYLAPALAALLLLGASAQVHSSDASGATVGYTCMGCHGANGISKGSIVSLAGRNAEVMTRQLIDFKNDEREGTVMNRIAKGYTDEELRAVAEFFAGLPAN
ncbi:MAG: c-type cytochrome [Halothiobacillaceae bacterium]